MFRRILVAVDGTPTSKRGLVTAIALAREQNSELHVLHVIDDTAIVPIFDASGYAGDYFGTIVAGLREAGQKILSKAEVLAAKSGQTIKPKNVETGGQGVAHSILQHARSVRADLIVMGTHGRRGLSRLVLGSDAEGVLREATVPVLLIRSPEVKRATKVVKGAAGKAPQAAKRPTSRRRIPMAME